MRVLFWLVGFGRFWYHFIIGDDWTVAAALAVGLAADCAAQQVLSSRRGWSSP